jgi:hypothetical protein
LLPDNLALGDESKRPGPRTRPDLHFYLVGATGFEPVTSSVSGGSGTFEEQLDATPYFAAPQMASCISDGTVVCHEAG